MNPQQPPYGQPYPNQAPPQRVNNPMGNRALWTGVATLVINTIGFFIGFFLTGILAVFGIIYGVRGLGIANRYPSKPGMVQSVLGIIFSLLSIGMSLLGYISLRH